MLTHHALYAIMYLIHNAQIQIHTDKLYYATYATEYHTLYITVVHIYGRDIPVIWNTYMITLVFPMFPEWT